MSGDNEALAQAVIDNLGPHALTGGKMSVLQAFELGWQAALSQAQEPVAITATYPNGVVDLHWEVGAVDSDWAEIRGGEPRIDYLFSAPQPQLAPLTDEQILSTLEGIADDEMFSRFQSEIINAGRAIIAQARGEK